MPVGDLLKQSLAESLSALAQATAALAKIAQSIESPAVIDQSLSRSPASGPTVHQVLEEFLLSRDRAGRSSRYLRQARVSLGSLAKFHRGKRLAAITSLEIENWLHAHPWQPRNPPSRTQARPRNGLLHPAAKPAQRGHHERGFRAGLLSAPRRERRPPGG